jgi:hypothetical protein
MQTTNVESIWLNIDKHVKQTLVNVTQEMKIVLLPLKERLVKNHKYVLDIMVLKQFVTLIKLIVIVTLMMIIMHEVTLKVTVNLEKNVNQEEIVSKIQIKN